MKLSNRVYHRPYIAPNRQADRDIPYICRLIPEPNGFGGEWFDTGCAGAHKLVYMLRGTQDAREIALTDEFFSVTGLEQDKEYAFYIEAENGARSHTRLVRTGDHPEGSTVINYLHPEDLCYSISGQHLGSPAVVRLHTGTIIVGMDVFGPPGGRFLQILYRSTDGGRTFRFLNELHPFFWSYLFEHKNVLYILGASTDAGDLRIAASYDEGDTWTPAVTLLYGGTAKCTNGGMHRAPMPVVSHNGRLYTSCEYGLWEHGFGNFRPSVLSIDENADLLDPENWHCTGFLPYDGAWKAACDKPGELRGDGIEGNVVVAPDGKTMYLYLRWKVGQAVRMIINPDDPDAPLAFDKLIEMPVVDSMFKIVPYHGRYYMFTNRATETSSKLYSEYYRNVLSVFVSDDLENWTLVKDIINRETEDTAMTGFQYPQISMGEGDILVAVRSAFNHPHSFHDSNHMLLWRIPASELK